MSDSAYWPGTKMLRKDILPAGSASATPATSEARPKILELLNQALGIAQAAARRCEHRYIMAFRSHSSIVAAAALEHANEVQLHSDGILKRIAELGGTAESVRDMPSDGMTERTHANPLLILMNRHLAAEQASVRSYRAIASLLSAFDPVSQGLIEGIAHNEQACAAGLAGLLEDVSALTH